MNTDKTVLITGAATRLGRETALHLASCGWDVVVHHRTSAQAAEQTAEDIRALGRRAAVVQGDLSDTEAPAQIAAEAVAAMGAVTALVNNAAVFERDTLADFTAEQFDKHMALNLRAPLLLAQAFINHTKKGAIVNLVDGGDGLSLSPSFLTYTLSKNALRDATPLLAKALAPAIRVNAVAPGLTLPKSGEEEMFSRLTAALPLGTATSPASIAEAVRYLLETPDITGQILKLNGGAGL